VSARLLTRDAVAAIAGLRTDEVVILTMSGMGFWPETGERDFRLVGLMGAAASLGLGVALGAPNTNVWVVDGDGSALMRLGVLAAIGDAAPPRLTHIVLANGVYAVSGGQPVPGSPDWAQLALAAGYPSACRCDTAADLEATLRQPGQGPRLVVVHCDADGGPFPPGAFQVDVSGEARRLRGAMTDKLTDG